ncbi:MAG: AzlC family ABC transporter permease [Rhodocyclales bacterium]|nr:AzlC family ABC transporter permease [Rhodocyclales bacterium]
MPTPDHETGADRRRAFLAGLRACLPLLPSILPFGMVCGAAAAGAGLSFGQAFALSWMVFAGSSQIVATQLFAAGAPGWVIVATGWIVNLRFAMYSAALAPHFRGVPPGRRWLGAYLLTDQAFAVTMARALEGRAGTVWFYLGIAATLWLLWQVSSLAGILLGTLIPASWSVDFVVALTFIALLAPLLRDRYLAAAALAGGAAAVLLDLPMKLNLMAAAAAGVAVGLALERLWPKSQPGR